MAISSNLKNARIAANLSQAELAEKLELNTRTYRSYERGERDVGTALLLKICTTLGISSDVLLGIQNENEQKNIAPTKISRDEGQSLLSGLSDTEITELLNYLGYLRYKRENGL